MTTINFTVPGAPMAQPRQRHRIAKGKTGQEFVQNFTPAKAPVNEWKAAVKLAATEAYQGPPMEGPVCVSAVFVFPRRKTKIYKKKAMPRERHDRKPDLDNVEKALYDALNGLIFRDDSQIYMKHVEKYEASGDEQPRTEIQISDYLKVEDL